MERNWFQLPRAMSAWNIDGSASDNPTRLGGDSWIDIWESSTGLARVNVFCSYDTCSRQAEVGGHVWIAYPMNGVYIAPICRECNSTRNTRRMQGDIKAGIDRR